MTEKKTEKPKEPELIQSDEEAEEEVKDIQRYKTTPEQKAELERLDEEIKKLPKGKRECPICHKIINTRGFNNHVEACKRKQEEREARAKYKIPDQLPKEQTTQEARDKKEMKRVTDEITQKQNQGITFSPEQIAQYQQIMNPIAERQNLRNQVAVTNMESQIENTKRKGDDLEWKDIIALKKVEAMNNSKSNNNNNDGFIALMNSQTQSSQNMFMMMMENQKQAHAEAMANQQRQFDYMTKMAEKKEKEDNVFTKIKEMKESAELIGLKDKDEESSFDKIATLVGGNMQHIPALISSLKGQNQNPPQLAPLSEEEAKEQYISTRSHTEGENSIGTIPYSLPSPSGSPTIAPPYLSDQEVEQYARQNYVETQGESPFTDMYAQLNNNFVPKNE